MTFKTMNSKPAKASVLLVCDYSLNYLGGAQIAFMRQVRALLGEGYPVTVVAPAAKQAFAHTKTPLLTIIEPQVRFTIPGVQLPIVGGKKNLAKRLNSLLSNGRFAGVVVHSEFALAAIALREAKFYGLPVLQTVHTFFWRAPTFLSVFAPLVTLFHTRVTRMQKYPKYRGSTPINNALRSMTLRFTQNVNGVISPSKHQAAKLRLAGVENVYVVSNVIQKVEDAPVVSYVPLKVVWAGRFAPEKRLSIALAAIKQLATTPDVPPIELHVAGGELADFSAAEIKIVGHGRVSSEEVSDLIKEANVVLVTSLGFDNQPMVALEGFAKKRPVIVTDPALQEEFGEASILSKNPNAQGLAETLIEIAKNPETLKAHEAAATEYAAERGAAKHVTVLLSLLLPPDSLSVPPSASQEIG